MAPIQPQIPGLHHVTALATHPQANLEFYRDVLGLRLVKQTVNFDDPGSYHLYYGDALGRPGTILTFFPWPHAQRGTRGVGQATATAFSVPPDALGFWVDRLQAQQVIFEAPQTRWDEEVLTLLDHDGLKLELVAHAGAEDLLPWTGSSVPERYALRGFHSVTLETLASAPTAALLNTLGFRPTRSAAGRTRFEVGAGGAGAQLDLVERPQGTFGRIAAGTVHHVAWRTPDEQNQRAWQKVLAAAGHGVTEVRDRNYFRSIYFREPGGVLFEIATDLPGFTVDEPVASLGSTLRLPAWLEPERQAIEAHLPPLTAPAAVLEERS